MARTNLDDWIATFRERAFPGMRAVDGWLGITIYCARDGDPCAVTVTTTWQDEAAIRRYAGDDAARTVMPDFMARFFTEYDPEATFHDELFSEPNR